MNEEAKALSGILFNPGDPDLVELKRNTHNLNVEYNRTFEDDAEIRDGILGRILRSKGSNCRIQGPIFFHYGVHTTIGDNFFANFNFTVQDDALVTIGSDCSFGPNVTIVTPVHPLVAAERVRMLDSEGKPRRLCYAKPVVIGDNCWLGANVVVCPGVTIGANCVIGAGSVVVKDIPADSVAAGNPCRVLRPITDADSLCHKPELLGEYRVSEEHT